MRSHGRLRADAAKIWAAGLLAVEPAAAVRRWMRREGEQLVVGRRRFRLDRGRRVWVLGAGKAAAPMARAVETILGNRIHGGLVVTRYGYGLPLRRLTLLEAGHPFPDENGVAAAAGIARLAGTEIGAHDLVICLLSGGGSALLAAPAPGITLADKLACTRLLLNCGATIQETNAVRKHLSVVKGGGLARMLAAVRVISLILSDVVGDDLDAIASGPLVPDTTTFADCKDIVRRLGIENRLPRAVRRRLDDGAGGGIPETPKPGDPIFRNKFPVMVGSNAQACGAAAAAARRLGYRPLVLTSRLAGDTREAARFHLSIAEEIAAAGRPVRRPACLISGGESTVLVTGKGKGGRNQEFVLQCVSGLARQQTPCVAASIATDGSDGPTDAAGALADNRTLARSFESGSRFLEDCIRDNDAYEFFRRLDDLVVTGPTRTNVMDLHLFMVG